jgi:hypothetical protein
MRIRNPVLYDPGSGMEKFGYGIQDINIPDPQQWSQYEYFFDSLNILISTVLCMR